MTPNPSGCCGVTTPCCGDNEIGELLTASITNVFNCDCVDGAEISLELKILELDPETKWWEGSGPFGSCGRDIILRFYCVGVDCNGFRLDYSFSDNCDGAGVGLPPESCECDPLSAVFKIGTAGGCCTPPPTLPEDEETITVTE